MGIESGPPIMQKKIKKNLNINEAMEKVKEIKKRNIRLTTSFIYGFPMETEKQFMETLKVIYL